MIGKSLLVCERGAIGALLVLRMIMSNFVCVSVIRMSYVTDNKMSDEVLNATVVNLLYDTRKIHERDWLKEFFIPITGAICNVLIRLWLRNLRRWAESEYAFMRGTLSIQLAHWSRVSQDRVSAVFEYARFNDGPIFLVMRIQRTLQYQPIQGSRLQLRLSIWMLQDLLRGCWMFVVH